MRPTLVLLKRYTQSQKDVMALYRRGLRAIRSKPEATRPNFHAYLRHAFRHPSMGGGVRARDFSAIDYLMRRGTRMMEDVFESRGVKDIGLPAGADTYTGRIRRE